ncbi:MAG: ribosome silencing factor [Bernardetiaceae bacterium]
MTKKNAQVPSLSLVQLIVAGMQEKKAKDILILDLREIPQAVADYFVIATGTTDVHVDAIQQSVQKEVHLSHGERPWHSEGQSNREWVLLDFVDVVAHVFQEKKRQFYRLEELWGDARFLPVPDQQFTTSSGTE